VENSSLTKTAISALLQKKCAKNLATIDLKSLRLT
jgi:hypothetical protein